MRQLISVLMGCLLLTGVLVGCSQSFESEPKKEPVPPPAPPPKVETPRSDCRKVVYAFPTGDPRTSIALLEKCMPPEVVVGVPFDFTLTVINTSETLCLEDVVVTDKLPDNMKLDSANPNPDAQGSTLRWSFGRMNPKETKVIKAKGIANSAGTILQCATLNCTPKACLEIVAVQPAIKLAKSAPSEVLLCDEIPMVLTVTNTGSGVAREVTVADALPAGLTTTDGRTSVSVAVGDLAPNQSKEVRIQTKASKTGKYENKGTASAAGGLKADSNTTSTLVKQPVLEIAKKALQEKVLVGRGIGTFTHEITVKNTGDAVAAGTVVLDTPPAGVTVVKADGAVNAGGKLQWNAGDLQPGASKTMQVTFSTGVSGTYTNSATASARCASPVSAEAKTVVSGIPAVLLEMADDPDPVKVGDIVTYTIVVTNQGSADDTNITISCDLTDEMQFVSCGPKNLPNNQPPGASERYTQVPSSQGKLDGKSVKFDPVARLGAKEYVAWEVKVKALKGKDVRFWTTLTTDQTKAGGEIKKNESTNFYE